MLVPCAATKSTTPTFGLCYFLLRPSLCFLPSTSFIAPLESPHLPAVTTSSSLFCAVLVDHSHSAPNLSNRGLLSIHLSINCLPLCLTRLTYSAAIGPWSAPSIALDFGIKEAQLFPVSHGPRRGSAPSSAPSLHRCITLSPVVPSERLTRICRTIGTSPLCKHISNTS